MAAFVHSVGPALKTRGLYVLVNAHKWLRGTLARATARSRSPMVATHRTRSAAASTPSPGCKTRPIRPASRSVGSEWWNTGTAGSVLSSVAQSTGADFFGYTYGPRRDTRAMRFGKASFLLDWDGEGGALLYA